MSNVTWNAIIFTRNNKVTELRNIFRYKRDYQGEPGTEQGNYPQETTDESDNNQEENKAKNKKCNKVGEPG